MTPQLALRVAILGTFALAMFAIIFFRLWFLQVLSGDQYAGRRQASTSCATIAFPAPRGEILDSSGTDPASSQAVAVQISPADLPVPISRTDSIVAHPPRRDALLYADWRGCWGCPTNRRAVSGDGHGAPGCRRSPARVAQGYVQVPYADVTVATRRQASSSSSSRGAPDQFPGVSVQPIYLRTYPLDDLAAQLFGTIGPITAQLS